MDSQMIGDVHIQPNASQKRQKQHQPLNESEEMAPQLKIATKAGGKSHCIIRKHFEVF